MINIMYFAGDPFEGLPDELMAMGLKGIWVGLLLFGLALLTLILIAYIMKKLSKSDGNGPLELP